jgi:rhodanese-related sulfurtransferase
MKILVTGAAGFIGMHVAQRLLARGDEVVGIDNLNDYYDPALKQARLARLTPQPGFRFQRLDVADRAGVKRARTEHLQAFTSQVERTTYLLDVRTPEEFAQGHLKGAKNIDIRQPDFYSRVDKLDKNQTYLVYCRTNHRSGVAVEYMSQHGFQKLYQMMDGFPGWAGNNLPAEK